MFYAILPLDENGASDGPSNDVSMDGVVKVSISTWTRIKVKDLEA
jgi:hypothetical protein